MKKTLMVIGGIVVGIVIIVAAVFFIVSLTSDKLSCKSDMGNLKVMYKGENIKGYVATGHVTFDEEEAQKYVDLYGMENYLDTLSETFAESTGGSCEMK